MESIEVFLGSDIYRKGGGPTPFSKKQFMKLYGGTSESGSGLAKGEGEDDCTGCGGLLEPNSGQGNAMGADFHDLCFSYGFKSFCGKRVYYLGPHALDKNCSVFLPVIIESVTGNVAKGYRIKDDLTLSPCIITKSNGQFEIKETD